MLFLFFRSKGQKLGDHLGTVYLSIIMGEKSKVTWSWTACHDLLRQGHIWPRQVLFGLTKAKAAESCLKQSLIVCSSNHCRKLPLVHSLQSLLVFSLFLQLGVSGSESIKIGWNLTDPKIIPIKTTEFWRRKIGRSWEFIHQSIQHE